MKIVLELDEGERQLVLLALAQLSLRNPGFDYALNLIALKVDNPQDGRGQLFDQFRSLRFNGFKELVDETGENDGG